MLVYTHITNDYKNNMAYAVGVPNEVVTLQYNL